MKNKLLGKPEVNMILGKTESDAVEHLKDFNYTMRVINRDGSPAMTTNDVDESRVNVFIIRGKVDDIHNIG